MATATWDARSIRISEDRRSGRCVVTARLTCGGMRMLARAGDQQVEIARAGGETHVKFGGVLVVLTDRGPLAADVFCCVPAGSQFPKFLTDDLVELQPDPEAMPLAVIGQGDYAREIAAE
ncbi:MAG: hypothetical protein ACE15C_14600 [Phycisphaerae bacterium]